MFLIGSMAEPVDKEHSYHTIYIISTHTKKKKEMKKNSCFKPHMAINSRRIRDLYKIFKQ